MVSYLLSERQNKPIGGGVVSGLDKKVRPRKPLGLLGGGMLLLTVAYRSRNRAWDSLAGSDTCKNNPSALPSPQFALARRFASREPEKKAPWLYSHRSVSIPGTSLLQQLTPTLGRNDSLPRQRKRLEESVPRVCPQEPP